MTKIKLLKDIGDYKAGEVEVTEERATYWLRLGVAEEIKQEQKKAPAKKKA